MNKIKYKPRRYARFRDLRSMRDVFKDLKKYHRVIDLSQTVIYEPRKKVFNNEIN